MLLCISEITSPGCNASLCVLPAEIPKVLPGRLDVRFFHACVVPDFVPFLGRVQIAGIDTHTSRLVRDLSLLEEVLHAAIKVEDVLLVLDCLLATSLESV